MLPPPRRTSTLADAFSHVSSSLTSSVLSGARQRPERTRVYEAVGAYLEDTTTHEQASYTAHKLVLADDDSHSWVELEGECILRDKPFAHGGQRNAFRLFHSSPSTDGVRAPYVAKESRFAGGNAYKERLSEHKLSLRIATKARTLAATFERRVSLLGWPPIHVVECEIYRLHAPASPGGYRYLCVEPFLSGTWTKFNGNNGFVGERVSDEDGDALARTAATAHDTAQAFTHWTYEHTLQTSGAARMVCDIQGVGFKYTDVSICSEERLFGKTDRGHAGLNDFFKHHRCNQLCASLGLTSVIDGVANGESGQSGSRTTATSAIDIIRTKHLNNRKRQRDIHTYARCKRQSSTEKRFPGTVLGAWFTSTTALQS